MFECFAYSFGNLIHFPDPTIVPCFAISSRSRFSLVFNTVISIYSHLAREFVRLEATEATLLNLQNKEN